jgi:hypothetical protein
MCYVHIDVSIAIVKTSQFLLHGPHHLRTAVASVRGPCEGSDDGDYVSARSTSEGAKTPPFGIVHVW